MKKRTVFTPVHQCQQQLVGQREFAGTAKRADLLLESLQHLGKNSRLDTGEPLKLFGLAFFDLFVSHSPQFDSPLMKEVY